jgi:hypothetical protein
VGVPFWDDDHATYEHALLFAAVWPSRTVDEYAHWLNRLSKYVAAPTLR